MVPRHTQRPGPITAGQAHGQGGYPVSRMRRVFGCLTVSRRILEREQRVAPARPGQVLWGKEGAGALSALPPRPRAQASGFRVAAPCVGSVVTPVGEAPRAEARRLPPALPLASAYLSGVWRHASL